jgi:hypothetical protein
MVINNRIPNDKKQEVTDVVDKVLKALPNPPRPFLLYLFEVYNEYVAPAHRQENINCGECRTKVVGHLRTITNEWKQQNTTLDK